MCIRRVTYATLSQRSIAFHFYQKLLTVSVTEYSILLSVHSTPSQLSLPLDLEHFDFKVQSAARGNAPGREPGLPVPLVRGNLEVSDLANRHAQTPLVPARDHLPDPSVVRERLLPSVLGAPGCV